MSGDWHLAIESSASSASVAAGRGGRAEVIAGAEGARQSEILMTPLSEVLGGVPASRAIGLVLIGTGPGSYNGARVGIAAGQGVALVHGCPAVGLCSLEALEPVRSGTPCLAVGDARRGTYSAFELRDGRLSGEPELLEKEAFVARVIEAAKAGNRIVTMEALDRLPGAMRDLCEPAVPSAALLLAAWGARTGAEREELLERPPQPFYLRPPYVTKSGPS